MNATCHWNGHRGDDNARRPPARSGRVIDIAFRLDCRRVRVDHANGLHRAITAALPWFNGELLAGLHLIHLAGSQNGWQRPQDAAEPLYLSKRTRLNLRVPLGRVSDAKKLTGATLDINGDAMRVQTAREKPLIPGPVLLSRHVAIGDDTINGYGDEGEFLRAAAAELSEMGVRFGKLLPGRRLDLRGPGGVVQTRSLLVADLEAADSLTLQEQGIGGGRKYGCGLFIRHKGIGAANAMDADTVGG